VLIALTIFVSSLAYAGGPVNLADVTVGEALPDGSRAVCVPFGGNNQSRCKPQQRTVAGMEGNLGIELCDGKIQQASWVTMYLPKGHAVPGSKPSTDPMSDARAGFDALRKMLIADGWKVPESGEMGAAQVEAVRDGVKATIEMGEIPAAPQLPAGSWSTGVVLQRVEPCS
jgi:hypothetical protein